MAGGEFVRRMIDWHAGLSQEEQAALESRVRTRIVDAALWSLLLAVMIAPLACAFVVGRCSA